MTRVFVYETTSADPSCADAELQAQGRSMRDAMVADLMEIDGVQVGVAVLGDGRQGALGAEGWLEGVRGNQGLPPASGLKRASLRDSETPVEFLQRQALLHDFVWVVAPESDGELGALCEVVSDGRWLGCSAEAIAIAASKRATSSHLRAAGIAATEAVQPADCPAAATRNAGWVVKPDDGCGASGARRHRDHASASADFSDRLQRGEDVVMEPWIEGDPLSLSLLCGETSVEVLSINRQSLAFDPSGRLHFQGVVPQAGTWAEMRAGAMASLARCIKDALPGLHGYVGVDVTWHPERGPVVIEINPRVTCAYRGLSKRIGFNVAERLLALHRRPLFRDSCDERETADRY